MCTWGFTVSVSVGAVGDNDGVPQPRRRSTDQIDPAIALAIKEGDDENRHWMRNELTALGARLDGTLALIAERLTALEKNDAVLDALASNKRALWGAALTLAGLIIAAAGTVVAILT